MVTPRALGTPNIYEPFAFDATLDFTFTFAYTGSQAMKNRLIVRDNASNAVIYDAVIASMQLAHLVPAGTLTNGTLYNATVTVYDREDNVSLESAPVIFYCYTTPTLSFTNMMAYQVVKNSSFELEISYVQPEMEPLNSYQVILYNSLSEPIHKSGNKYPNEATTFKHILSSLDDNTMYFVQAKGETLNHMVADTGLIPFSVEYINPSVFATVGLENLAKEGQIKIQSNIISILGKSNPDPPIFIDGKEVDVTGDDHWIIFDEGFQIDKDFTMMLRMRKPNDYSTIMVFNQGQAGRIELKYMRGKFASETEEKACFHLRAFNGVTNYMLVSNYIDLPLETDYLYVWMRRKNDVYELIAENLGGGQA